ncbi:putative alcohol dehydrogenase [Thelonectria olida]|uniref:Alcohol dehydrogenase n=1 Tax=Thelonectria olida TaxID=1576542 RepID=A0A9P9ALA8_9HYPO|nr:putative alcohol dehydrogenase [Thelonectria olida]
MTQAIPQIIKQWNLIGYNGFDSLELSERAAPEVGDNQVLVKIQGASVNYRDLIIAQGGYPWDLKPNVVPGSDGAGTVLAVGKHVSRFKPGDEVVTIINQQHLGGSMNPQSLQSGLGGAIDGTLRSIGVFDEQGLVTMPKGLTFIEAATLSCAGLTAWNALFGLPGKRLCAGQWVLTQGTGGVSIFAVQFAKAVGARVIATTSSQEKSQLLKKLGADHVINYRETADWGSAAKELTGGSGVDLVVEVSGNSMAQSVASLKLDATIAIVGSVGGDIKEQPGLLTCWTGLFTARGVWVGNRLQMEEMCQAIEANLDKLRPVIDQRVFTLDQVRDAYEYQWSGKHQGKVGIQVS